MGTAPDRAAGSVIGSGELYAAGSPPSHCAVEWRTQVALQNRLPGTPAAGGLPPLLSGRGTAQVGSALSWTVAGPPYLPAVFGSARARIDTPLLGALLLPFSAAVLFRATDGNGTASLQPQIPPTVPASSAIWSQVWIVDPLGAQGFTASNALECRTSL